ncbi:hypothetical protein DL766_006165 [Monosporascus sp. MC13-8B]|uniref:Phospholipase/carboxylesterase/thioesterase domain-containing protein n=1 Tax=Monosporascus cannonballus TaxID=155416 RepID=A0ABY0HFS9_9PEZI|nr:hypothetical protein DL762_002559 [Monosporascus cannonballus]RYO95204.1 hypothetical protein DL763_003772 [Monosporascus cannonballus]RYP27858.1 hypothetical protein DL766_006165 [Monosporascus sp. MC13-8B]
MATSSTCSRVKDPGYEHAKTQHISFDFFDQRTSNAPFGHEHYVSLPPAYESDPTSTWPWDLAMHTPYCFASLMPICGGGDSLRVIHIKHVPHWVHHGALDDIIPFKASKQMVDALTKAGTPEIRFTRYPDLMHDSWTAAYNNPEAYRWMPDARRRVKGDEVTVPKQNKIVAT